MSNLSLGANKELLKLLSRKKWSMFAPFLAEVIKKYESFAGVAQSTYVADPLGLRKEAGLSLETEFNMPSESAISTRLYPIAHGAYAMCEAIGPAIDNIANNQADLERRDQDVGVDSTGSRSGPYATRNQALGSHPEGPDADPEWSHDGEPISGSPWRTYDNPPNVGVRGSSINIDGESQQGADFGIFGQGFTDALEDGGFEPGSNKVELPEDWQESIGNREKIWAREFGPEGFMGEHLGGWFATCFDCDFRIGGLLTADLVLPDALFDITKLLDGLDLNLNFAFDMMRWDPDQFCPLLHMGTWCIPDLMALLALINSLFAQYSMMAVSFEFSLMDLLGLLLVPLLEMLQQLLNSSVNLTRPTLKCLMNSMSRMDEFEAFINGLQAKADVSVGRERSAPAATDLPSMPFGGIDEAVTLGGRGISSGEPTPHITLTNRPTQAERQAQQDWLPGRSPEQQARNAGGVNRDFPELEPLSEDPDDYEQEPPHQDPVDTTILEDHAAGAARRRGDMGVVSYGTESLLGDPTGSGTVDEPGWIDPNSTHRRYLADPIGAAVEDIAGAMEPGPGATFLDFADRIGQFTSGDQLKLVIYDFEARLEALLEWVRNKLEILKSQLSSNVAFSLNITSVLMALNRTLNVVSALIQMVTALIDNDCFEEDSDYRRINQGIGHDAQEKILGKVLPPWATMEIDTINSGPEEAPIQRFTIMDNSLGTSVKFIGCVGKIKLAEKQKVHDWINDLNRF
tara:strand:- start:31215 stop:33440 length:2226 start_codon:yes stop_codon:yes gene_type:complete